MMSTVKRRRLSSVVVVATAVVVIVVGVVLASGHAAAASNDNNNNNNGDDVGEAFRRKLAQSAAETFASYTPTKITRALPLDLKIDYYTGEAYIAGRGGYLTPYSSSLSPPSSSTATDHIGAEGGYWDNMIHLDNVVLSNKKHHTKSTTTTTKASTRNVDEETDLIGQLNVHKEHSSKITSVHHKTSSSRERGDDSNRSLRGITPMEEEEGVSAVVQGMKFSRVVSSNNRSRSLERRRPVKNKNEQDEEEDDDEESSGSSSIAGSIVKDHMKTRGRNGNTNKDRGGSNSSSSNKLPRIGYTEPNRNGKVRDVQTFSARVLPSKATGASVKSVHFQLSNENGEASELLVVPKITNELYEITIDGFSRYAGSTWTYSIIAKDTRGRRRSTDDISFNIVTADDFDTNKKKEQDEGEENDEEEEEEEGVNRSPPAPDSSSSSSSSSSSTGSKILLPQKYETDTNWSYAGAIQAATGRILFEFDNTGQTYVCSGTVIHDGPSGKTPDHTNGRSIIQTAAHCAYSDVMKTFATKAIFIPDQSSTTGDESDFNCRNDRYGCWHLSFAVVAEGWTTSHFPENVPYDYAYYVAFDDPATHSGGWEEGLTGLLDVDIQSMKIDFDTDLHESSDENNDFIYSIGYSADRDPSLRHCAMEHTTIFGVDWYENFWLDNCAMTGGASGGPWMVNMDTDGVGTLVSVNSWGFAHRIGMAGPSLRTSSGSLAECLYNKAKDAKDPGNEGGYIMSNC